MTQQSMKGLFKGLRFISQVFDEKDDEEIQIGFPTDVKHVAHIGCDNSSSKAPEWMNGFKQPSEGPGNGDANPTPTSSSSNTQVQQEEKTITKTEPSESTAAAAAARSTKSKKTKQSKQSHSLSSDSVDSITTTTNKPRRAKHPSLDSACPEPMDQERVINSSIGSEPNNGDDLAKVPRKTHKKKTKDGSSEGTTSKTSKTRRAKTSTQSSSTQTTTTTTDSNIINETQPRTKTPCEGDENK